MSFTDVGGIIQFLFLSVTFGAIYGVVMSIPAFFLTQLLRVSLKGMISGRAASGIFGGMTGFLCSSGGGWFFSFGMISLQDWQMYFPILLAVVMGHAGAIWFGYLRRNEGFPFFDSLFSFEKQITIGYLMKLTAIVAALSLVFKAVGSAGISIGIGWLVYLLLQTLLLVCDSRITRLLSERW